MLQPKHILATLFIVIVISGGALGFYLTEISKKMLPSATATSTSPLVGATTTFAFSTTKIPFKPVAKAAAPTVKLVSSSPATSTPKTEPKVQTFILRLGESMSVDDVIATVKDVIEDNRCGNGKKCSRDNNGRVVVQLKLQKGIFSTTQTLSLGVPVSAFGFTAELIEVTSSNDFDRHISDEDYRFTFRISQS